MKQVTLCFLIKEENEIKHICLAMKKRGFGEGKWNGVGGKVESNETIEEAVAREALEEIGVEVSLLNKVAELSFPTDEMECHVYFTENWVGEPTESEEMLPKWFNINGLPYNEMWDEDRVWLPFVLEGKKIKGVFCSDGNQKLISHEISEVINI